MGRGEQGETWNLNGVYVKLATPANTKHLYYLYNVGRPTADTLLVRRRVSHKALRSGVRGGGGWGQWPYYFD